MGIVPLVCTTSATAYNEIAETASSPAPDSAGPASWLQGGWWMIPIGAILLVLFCASRSSRLTRLPRQPWNFRPGVGYSFVLLSIIVGAIGAQIALAFTGQPSEESTDAIRILTIVTMVSLSCQGAVLLCMPGWWSRRAPGQEDTRPGFGFCAVFGLFALAIFWPIVQSILLVSSMIRTSITGEPPSEIAHDTLLMLSDSDASGWRWALVAMIILMVPVVEETIYRGLLQESLRRHRTLTNGSSWLAITIASVIFTVMHGGVTSIEGLVSLFVLSLGLGWAFARTGRLITPIVMHAGFNAWNILLASFL
ncbi:MAG: CPBP family intramembrane metalloprotease [Phycisphaerales bacterium]|nr:CPBP family intramembrane metalloprotease [Phycisphaerales bacterium]